MREFINIDCMEFFKNLENDSVDLILTDIPYGGVNDFKDNERKRFANRFQSLGNADIMTFDLENFCEECLRISKGNIFIFCGIEQVSLIFKFFKDKKIKENEKISVRQVVYLKNNPMPVNGKIFYISSLENAIVIKKPGGAFNAEFKKNIYVENAGSKEYHPTQKNLNLIKNIINDLSRPGELVFDPCAGSGTTLIAAHETGRDFLGCEKDKVFYEKAIKRVNESTSQRTIFDYMKNP